MFSFKSIVLIAGAFTVAESSGIAAVPAVAAAPLIAPAHVGYASAIPQNIPPYASQVSVVNRAVSPLIAGPVATAFAGPIAGAVAGPAPYLAGPSPYLAGPSPYIAGPSPYLAGPSSYLAGPSPYLVGQSAVLPSPYAAPLAAPYSLGPYGAPALRTAFGYAPTFVR